MPNAKRKRSRGGEDSEDTPPKKHIMTLPSNTKGLHVEPPVDYAAGPSNDYESSAPWIPAVGTNVVESDEPDPHESSSGSTKTPPPGVTRGLDWSPPLPNPLIKKRTTHPDTDFEKVEDIGKGVAGVVSIVKDKRRRNQELALKKIVGVSHPRKLIVAQREAIIMSRLKHKSICQIVEAYRWQGIHVHILMEPCHGDLYDYNENTLSKLKGDDKAGEIKHISIAILNGVEYMHGEGVMHRDLKTKNILMKAGGGIKICDFGMARKVDEKDVTGVRQRHYSKGMGTKYYKAPEMLLKHADYGCEVDMWSVACIIGELFVGFYVIQCENMFLPDGHIYQLNHIQRICGDIHIDKDKQLSADIRAGLTRGNTRVFRDQFQKFTDGNNDALDLLDDAFNLDPVKRPTATKLLGSHFFERGCAKIKSMRGVHRKFYVPT